MNENLRSFDVENPIMSDWNLPTLAHFKLFSKKKSKPKIVSSCDNRCNPKPEDDKLTTGVIKRSKKLCEIFCEYI